MFSFPHVPVFLPKLETCLTTRKGPTFKHCEAGYLVILPTKTHKGMPTTGRIFGTSGVRHVGPCWANICVWPVHLRPESRKCERWQPDHIHHGWRRCRWSISSTFSQGRRFGRKGTFFLSDFELMTLVAEGSHWCLLCGDCITHLTDVQYIHQMFVSPSPIIWYNLI